jgi:hypothetical protein
MREPLLDTIKTLKVGDVSDFSNFMGAVIKKGAFDKHQAAISEARETAGMKVIAGGGCNDREGWFVEPTLITTEDPGVRHMRDEFFGPIVTLHVYPDTAWQDTLQLVDRTSPYALTGAIFARDRAAIVEATTALRDAAGTKAVFDTGVAEFEERIGLGSSGEAMELANVGDEARGYVFATTTDGSRFGGWAVLWRQGNVLGAVFVGSILEEGEPPNEEYRPYAAGLTNVTAQRIAEALGG